MPLGKAALVEDLTDTDLRRKGMQGQDGASVARDGFEHGVLRTGECVVLGGTRTVFMSGAEKTAGQPFPRVGTNPRSARLDGNHVPQTLKESPRVTITYS